MKPVDFEQANTTIGPGPDQPGVFGKCKAFMGIVNGGIMDGSTIVVVAWQPSQEDIDQIVTGNPVFLTSIGGIMPHSLSTNFVTATTGE